MIISSLNCCNLSHSSFYVYTLNITCILILSFINRCAICELYLRRTNIIVTLFVLSTIYYSFHSLNCCWWWKLLLMEDESIYEMKMKWIIFRKTNFSRNCSTQEFVKSYNETVPAKISLYSMPKIITHTGLKVCSNRGVIWWGWGPSPFPKQKEKRKTERKKEKNEKKEKKERRELWITSNYYI